MRIVLACGAASLALATVAFAQDANVHEVVFKYRKSLSKIEGVIDVTAAGVNGEHRVLIRVASRESKEAIEQLLGRKLEGFPIHVLVTAAPKPACPPKPASDDADDERRRRAETTTDAPRDEIRPGPGQTVAAPRPGSETKAGPRDLGDPHELCDILREAQGLPARKDDGKGRCAWTRITKWVSPGVVERVGNGRDSKAGTACTHAAPPAELSALELAYLRSRGFQAVPVRAQKCTKCSAGGAGKDASEPPAIPGSSGWHKGEGVGTTFSTVVARHRKLCPLRIAEIASQVFRGLTP